MFLREFREGLHLTQNELSLKLDIAQTTIARYESNKIKPTSTIIFKYINELNANPNFLFLGLEPLQLNLDEEYLSQQNNEIIKDLSLSINQNELNLELNKLFISITLDKFSNKEEKSTIQNILHALKLEGHFPYRPFLFLYYVFKYVSENMDELKQIKSYKEYLISLTQRYNQYTYKNDPLFTKKIKSEISDNIELHCNESEIKVLLENPQITIQKLEEKMTSSMIRMHRNKDVNQLFPKK